MNEIAFLQDNYTVPVTAGNYMKFEKGDNIFRALSSVVTGFEYWNKDNKPVRTKKPLTTVPEDARLDDEGQFQIKHFWAFVAWNYKLNKIQVLEITQKSIMSAIQNLTKDEDWGSPFNYDIKVTRTGDKLETEYAVSPKPKTPVKPEIASAVASTPFDLDALFVGGDPFKPVTSNGQPMPTI